MESSSQKHFAFNYRHVLVDEIALEGLEGIGIDLLWRRVEKRISAPVTEKMRTRFWNYIVNCNAISFYQLPEPLARVEIIDRFQIIDEETGHLLDPSNYLDGPYEYNPVTNQYGSSIHFDTRQVIARENMKVMAYEKVVQEFGDTLVMVASIEERWHALAPHMPITYLTQLTPVHFCILELVGKGRENGQMTIGKTNLTKIIKDSKLLFYNRKHLQNMDLIRAQGLNQICGGRGCKSLLLRLKRFHQPFLLSLPKVGRFHDIVQHLIKKPDYCDTVEQMIKMGVFNSLQCKKLRKYSHLLNFEKKAVPIEESKIKKNKKTTRMKGYITLNPTSEESSQSDGETNEEPLQCEYKVHVNLMRQAYERFLDAGLKGLTQIELAQLLGVEFYTARTVCRTFKSKNIVREYFEDRGKQRIGKYVSTISATTEIDTKYEEEKMKFLGYLDVNDTTGNSKPTSATADSTESDSEIPKKKPKLEKDPNDIDNMIIDSKTLEESVTEISCLDGLENYENCSLLSSKKNPTLRQLKFANGIVKVVREKLAVSGYQTLSLLVAKEINDIPMAVKSLKPFVQKLVTDGQIKIMKISWPGFQQKYSIILCAPHVKPTDPVITAKYKEINMKSIKTKKCKVVRPVSDSGTKALTLYLYPRYMKIQKLHEVIMKLVYFNDSDTYHSTLPKGFSSLVDILPEFTLEFVLGHMSNLALLELTQAKIASHMLQKKLRNVPAEIFQMFLVSSSLQNTLRMNLKILAMFGLIQLIKEPRKSDDSNILSYEFYVNRHAKIIDTTGNWPRKNADEEALQKTYYFESFQDVETYWSDVYNISIKTNIVLDSKDRVRKHPVQAPRLRQDVVAHDNGQVLGNGLGPCGLDSSFHIEIPRFWFAYYTQLRKKHQLIQKRPMKLPRRAKPKKVVKPRVNIPKKKRPVMEKKILNHPLKRKRDGAIPKWSKEEDHILMLCKAAITVMSPTAGQPGCLMLRNVVAKDLISLYDSTKTGTYCHKRAAFLESNTALTYDRDCIINELKCRPQLLRKYEGLFKVLRLQHIGNMRKFMATAKLSMLELVWIMLQLVKSESFNRKVPCIATNLQDFHKNYTITSSCVNRNYNSYKTSHDTDPDTASIREGIILSVMTTFKCTQSSEIAKVIYAMFSPYKEQTLRPVIDQLRRCGAIAAKEKIMNSHMQKYNFQDIVQSSYKLSKFYQRKWGSRLNSAFVMNLIRILDEGLPQTGLKGSPEVNCLLLELQSCDIVEASSITAPVITGSSGSLMQEESLTAGEILMKYKLKSGTLGYKTKSNIKHFSELYKNLEYEKSLEILKKHSQVPKSPGKCETENEIISHLKSKKEAGSTFCELQDITSYDCMTLSNELSKLESMDVIQRVGYTDNIIVLTEYNKPWTIQIEDKLIIPTPWLTLDLDIRNEVCLKWAGEVVNKVWKNPGCSITYISDACEFLTGRAVQEICTLLEKCKCVTLKCIRKEEPDLFSEADTIPEIDDYNQYESMDNILVFPVKDSLTKYAYLRKKMFNDITEETQSS